MFAFTSICADFDTQFSRSAMTIKGNDFNL